MDYDTLIDAETWAFIHETEGYYPPDTISAGIAAQRATYDRMCRAFFTGYPDGVSAQDDRAGSVPIRIYECGAHDVTVIYFHGGGFVVGGLDSHDDVCAELCARSVVRVVSVDYRLSPESTHPAAFDDALGAAQYVALTWPGTHILAGDSAGGNLAAAVAHASRGAMSFAGLLLIYPGLGGDMTRGSYRDHAHAPMLTLDDLKAYEQIRFDGSAPENDPTAAPLTDSDFSNLPSTVIITAECDPLADDGRDYRDAIHAAGGKAVWVNEAGLVHGYLRARHKVQRARASFDRIVAATKMLAAGEWHD
ncbi:alpha/beta hydrolase [Aliiroseovarius sp. S1339]|uniref:alpha/beta hydrolase fold domain-containing protein n=1 Tax=Aliiroseovarius sp. S1339 TaxID=2936990 RepID=UPI0020C0141F|nr:alpha/beta hydrolase [Aliiroseovarius sp. S1339]MCK8463220.1 alpha/beta hydrolase [Aliiroseovarius sp. S1339]